MKYVAGLDGLRAMAVIAVLLFHAEFSFASGGFLGVSLFFTLSGFLITTLLIDEYETTGTLSLRRFYGRRVRRLLPAAYAGLALVVVLSGWWADDQLRRLPGDLIAAVANVANWRFAFSSARYEDLFLGAPSPVAHFWSLAIEEQIYLVLPVVVLFALRRGRGTLAVTTGVLLAASIGATLLTTDRDLIYNGTHTRAAELLAGVALAQILQQRARAGSSSGSTAPIRHDRRTVGNGVVGAIAVGGFVALVAAGSLQQSWIYRGGFVGVALLSSALIAVVVDGRFPARLLEARPLVAIGKVSYGIYLFHWPVFLVLDEQRTGLPQIPLFALRCAVTAALTVASYRLIEQPVRTGRVISRDRAMAPVMFASASLVAVAALLVVPAPTLTDTEELLALGTQEVVEFEAPTAPPVPSTPLSTDAELEPDVIDSVVGAPQPRPRIAVLGSDAATAAALRADPRAEGYDIIEDLRADCALSSVGTDGCDRLLERWRAMAVQGPVDALVIVTNASEIADAMAQDVGVISDEQIIAQAAAEEAMIAASLDTIDEALASGVEVLWYTPAHPVTAYFRHFARIGVERPAAHTVVGGTTMLLDSLRDVLAGRDARDHGGIDDGEPLRVLVIGDSTSLNFARALHDGSDGRVAVWWAGANGCPFAPIEATRGRSDRPWSASGCVPWHIKVPSLLDRFEPDALLVMTGPMELVEHRFAGDPTSRIAGDPVFAAARDGELDRLLAVLPAQLPVLVADLPAITEGALSGPEMTSPERLAAVNAQIFAWDEQSVQVARFPYRDTLEAAEAMRPVGSQIRSDGTHPDVEPLAVLARDTYVAELVAMIRQLRSDLLEATPGG